MSQTTDVSEVAESLSLRFLTDHVPEAVRLLQLMPVAEARDVLAGVPVEVLAPVVDALSPLYAEAIIAALPDSDVGPLLQNIDPGRAAVLLSRLDDEGRSRCLLLADEALANELRSLLEYPDNTAGRLMDTQVQPYRADMLVRDAIAVLRQYRGMSLQSIKIVDESNRLLGIATFRALLLAEEGRPLSDIVEPAEAVVTPMDPREEVVQRLEQFNLQELPVVDLEGHFLGIIRQAALVEALKASVSADMQTMVGASRDERALSTSWFAVRKRMPWLQVNLLTAFLAASVVGLFESTIATYTALAVLLPVVAGQSGNAGAQALAVTMRGLALREIRIAHWLRVLRKEVNTGFWNGISIAATCAIGVYFWSGSFGLVLVIASAMVIAMVAAGMAGALVPITLTRLGQDPAVASSIILTTVTDVVGFFSFLGIATLLAGMLS